MKSAYDTVKRFHDVFGLGVGDPITTESLRLRKTLHQEEHEEVLEHLEELPEMVSKPALTEELADQMIIALGTAAKFGLPIVEVFEEKMRANFSKLGDDGKPVRREDGKVLKGPNYQPANVQKFFV